MVWPRSGGREICWAKGAFLKHFSAHDQSFKFLHFFSPSVPNHKSLALKHGFAKITISAIASERSHKPQGYEA